MVKRKPYVHAEVSSAVKEKLAVICRKTVRKEADVVRGLLLRGIALWNRDGVVHDDSEEDAAAPPRR